MPAKEEASFLIKSAVSVGSRLGASQEWMRRRKYAWAEGLAPHQPGFGKSAASNLHCWLGVAGQSAKKRVFVYVLLFEWLYYRRA